MTRLFLNGKNRCWGMLPRTRSNMFSFQGMDKREIVVALAGLYRRQVCIAAAVIVSVALLLKPALTGVGAGIVWSLLDSLLLLALVMLYLVHRYNAGIVWMLVVFTLMHLALVVNLLIFTGRKEQKKES